MCDELHCSSSQLREPIFCFLIALVSHWPRQNHLPVLLSLSGSSIEWEFNRVISKHPSLLNHRKPGSVRKAWLSLWKCRLHSHGPSHTAQDQDPAGKLRRPTFHLSLRKPHSQAQSLEPILILCLLNWDSKGAFLHPPPLRELQTQHLWWGSCYPRWWAIPGTLALMTPSLVKQTWKGIREELTGM